MIRDFREHLAYLEKNGKLLKVKKEVDTKYEIAAGIRKISDTDGPALFFDRVKGFPGWKVAGGVYATQKLLALALDLPVDADEDSILKRYMELDDKRVKPVMVSEAPVQEIVIKGDDVDLTSLPIPIYTELDSGHYITCGVEIGKHPTTGIRNIAIHRRQVIGKNRTAILARGYQHLGMLITEAEKQGIGLPIATVIGVEPAVAIGSMAEVPEGVDELEVAGAIRGKPVELVKCKTIDLEVPANAEIVIEGVTIPGERFIDGPFGEFPGNYISLLGEPQSPVPVIKVTAVTMRKSPIFQAMLTGSPLTENHILRKWALASLAYRTANKIADVKAVNVTHGGAANYHWVVSIRKKDDSEPKKLLDTILSVRHGPKYAVIVDDDIDVYNPVDVEWAIATRMQAEDDVVIKHSVKEGDRQQSTVRIGRSKMGIDATAPVKDKKWYGRTIVPGVDKVDFV